MNIKWLWNFLCRQITKYSASSNLSKYLKKEKDTRGRKGYDLEAMLKIVLYAYIDEGQVSYSKLERLCKGTIPYILIANGETPSANTRDKLSRTF